METPHPVPQSVPQSAPQNTTPTHVTPAHLTAAPGAPRFADRVAIITGASRGIGLAIAERLVADGARVAITARGQEALDVAVERLGGPEHALGIAGKSDNPDHQDHVIATVTDIFGPVDFLVNNTGINPVFGRLVDVDIAAARKIFEVNVLGSLAWTQKVYRAALGERGGAVVFVSSVAGRTLSPGIDAYGASKAAIDRMVTALAAELGPHVRVNGVAPGVVRTKFAELLVEGAPEGARNYPLQRFGEPADIAGPVAFLLSQDAAWITGQVLTVDGGLLAAGGAL